jgi:polyamine oxidase
MTGAASGDRPADPRGGLRGSVDRVVVVGAGISGLTVANALSNAGVECVVLEGRNRIGGRLHTVDVAGHPVDLGGSWIHMPVGNPLTVLADQLGVARRPGDPTDALAGYDCAEARWLGTEEWASCLALQYEAFPDSQPALLERLGPNASMADAVETFLGEAGLSAPDHRRAGQALQASIEAEAAGLCRTQSLRWMWTELEYDGSYFGDLPVGGYVRIVEALARGLDIRQGVEVEEISWTESGVTVRDTVGAVEHASHIVVTVPLGVLKQGRPHFRPGLPDDRREAMDRLGFGSFEKVVLAFDEPFWEMAGVPHLVVFPPDPAEPAVWILGQQAFGAGPVLVALVFHTSARRVLDHPPHVAAEWVVGLLDQAFGKPCPPPVAVTASAWTMDRFAGGAYTHITPFGSPSDCELLGRPIDGRVLFAGEHTQPARLAYADGAMTSGLREANRLLGITTVD